jgi:hypothetical protein
MDVIRIDLVYYSIGEAVGYASSFVLVNMRVHFGEDQNQVKGFADFLQELFAKPRALFVKERHGIYKLVFGKLIPADV